MEKLRWEMEKLRLVSSVVVFGLLCLAGLCRAIESPQYAVIHVESDFEIRQYTASTWMSAPVNTLSFQKATLFGFHRLLQFIQGANLNFSRIPMTAPAVTSIVPGAGPFESSAYVVRFYLPVKFQGDPPTPLPELHLKPYKWVSHCVAVRKFSGYATDFNVAKEARKLAVSLSRTQWGNTTSTDGSYAYSIAQYDLPFHIFGRVNEVWADVSGIGTDCEDSDVAAY